MLIRSWCRAFLRLQMNLVTHGVTLLDSRFQVFISLVGIQLLKVPWVLWIVVEMPSVTTLFQA